SDVFSLGVIAYEVLTGEVPFLRPPVWARSRGEVPPAPPLAKKRPDLPTELHVLVDSCLDFDPGGRPSAAAVVAQLARIGGALGT
ncbi:MAG TPA: serine/threonine protein kinase, partial [Pseudomonadota bacterium]|nr:serine/threonine protein kinase [Pseudomonadota bacterium]